MADQKQDVNQAHHELERQRYRLQKELAEFRGTLLQLQDVQQRANQGDAVAIRQYQYLEVSVSGEFGERMKFLAAQVDELNKKYEHLIRIRKRMMSPVHTTDEYKNDAQVKLKKKRRTRIKYL